VLEFSPYEKEALSGLAKTAEALQKSDIADECRQRLELLAPPSSSR
jgi:hypothetical protein